MCGIAGFIDDQRRQRGAEIDASVRAMCAAIAHRGPDGQGIWVDESHGLGFGHLRLAIVDLSPTGVQPMASADRRWTITYNGEMYNYAELVADLDAAGARLRGTSDTEAFLECVARWGVEATLARVVGMFAVALWDARERRLWLIRDRLGVKPLYYAFEGGRLAFASELKGLRALDGLHWSLDESAFASYLRHGNVPAPATIYREARKLGPGEILTYQPGNAPRISCYWDFRAVARAGIATWNRPIDECEELDRIEALLRDSVRLRMVADVPVGAFLSGGIDSSLVVALMAKVSAQPVRSFTIGFHEQGYDEAKDAAAIAKALGTDHTEHYLAPGEALALIPGLSQVWDEPFADPSQIPTQLVSKLARRHVTVALSGDGGDEVFAGYNRYEWIDRLTRFDGPMGRLGRRVAGAAIRCLSPDAWNRLAELVPLPGVPRRLGEKLQKTASLLEVADPAEIYRRLVSQWQDPSRIAPRTPELRGVLWDASMCDDFPEVISRAQALDTMTYLPDDILTKVDRATMSVALEGREPLLDHRLIEQAWCLPTSFKMKDGRGKYVLRRILERHLPRELFERPKMGFGVPIDTWLRGPLRDWAETLLTKDALAKDGLLDPAPIRALWDEHLSGRRNHQYAVWVILMWQDWRARWAI
jgi:asparagine synthase (glutamine-hydrolysing)